MQAVGGAVTGLLSGFNEFYAAADESVTTTLDGLGVATDLVASIEALVADLCAA